MTVLKIAMCLCKSIVACTEEGTERAEQGCSDLSSVLLSHPVHVRAHEQSSSLGCEGS